MDKLTAILRERLRDDPDTLERILARHDEVSIAKVFVGTAHDELEKMGLIAMMRLDAEQTIDREDVGAGPLPDLGVGVSRPSR